MSDTPKTDKVTRTYGDASVEWEEELVPVDACRAIERELNAANAKIKRLVEAGDRMDLYAAPHDSDKWNEAKEAKP